MIEYLSGKLIAKRPLHIVLSVGGVGYGLDVPLTMQTSLGTAGTEATVYVHTHVQQDAIRLYGFATERERDLFQAMIGVSGIGPRTAIGIMSEVSVEEFAHAIVTDDLKFLTTVKGIGKKTAERMVLELRDKVMTFLRTIPANALNAGKTNPTTATNAQQQTDNGAHAGFTSQLADAIDALCALDCKRPVAERAVIAAAKDLGQDAELATLIRAALKYR